MRNKTTMILTAGLIILAANLYAEDNCPLAPIVKDAKPTLNMRLRYEEADLDGSESSEAFSLRTRLGYQTGAWKGLKAVVEFEDVQALNGRDDFNQAGLNAASNKTTIADIEGTEINQAYLQADCEMSDTTIKVGLQRIILDNARFVGNVGWRQNEQTYGGATLKNTYLEDLHLFYGYLSRVNRIFGQENGSEPWGESGNTAAFDSEAHLVNILYKPCEASAVTAYGYLLDLGEGTTAAALSSDTYGLRLTTRCETECGLISDLELEYAQQADNSATTEGVNYDADYIKADLTETYKNFSIGLGYELLGSDDGASFKTPLATGHKFNGWADLFLVTPADGLEDMYVRAKAVCPSGYTLEAWYHTFASDENDIDYGTELDLVLKKQLCEKATLVAKYAGYQADSDPSNPKANDIDRVSVQLDVAF